MPFWGWNCISARKTGRGSLWKIFRLPRPFAWKGKWSEKHAYEEARYA